jgi:hypothetical protein
MGSVQIPMSIDITSVASRNLMKIVSDESHVGVDQRLGEPVLQEIGKWCSCSIVCETTTAT